MADPQIRIDQASAAASISQSAEIDALAVANGSRETQPVSASLNAIRLGDRVIDARDASFAVTDGSQFATARGNSQSLTQSLVGGETAVAAVAVAISRDGATVDAQLQNSLTGIEIDGRVGGSGGITLGNNRSGASARGNDAGVVLTLDGANSGDIGNGASGSDFDHLYPGTPHSAVVGGDLIAAGAQRLESGSASRASLSDNLLGVSLTGEIDALTGGLALQGNFVSAEAEGNRLLIRVDETLAGRDVDTSLSGFQAVVDTDIIAGISRQRLGVAADTNDSRLQQTDLSLSGNRLAASAIANRGEAQAVTALDDAGDSLRLDSEQFLRATAAPAVNAEHRVRASVDDLVLGFEQRPGRDSNRNRLSLDANAVDATAGGNLQASVVDLGTQGLAAGASARVEAQQSLQLPGADLGIEALIGAAGAVRLGVSATTATGTLHDDLQLQLNGNRVSASAVGNRGEQALLGLAGAIDGGLSIEQSQDAAGSANDNLGIQAAVLDTGLGIGRLEGLGAPQLLIADNLLGANASANRQVQTLSATAGSLAAAAELGLTARQTVDDASVLARGQALHLGLADAGTAIGDSASGGDARLQVSGNRLNAAADLNTSSQQFAGHDGTLNGRLQIDLTQTAGANAGFNNSDALLDDVRLGLSGSGAVLAPSGDLSLLVSDNRLSAVAGVNRSERSIDALSGALSGTLDLSTRQAADGVASVAKAQGVEAGLTAADTALSGQTDRLNIAVLDNRVEAIAGQNQASEALAEFQGRLYGSRSLALSQESRSGFALGNNGGVALGVGANVLDANSSDLALGSASLGSTLQVSGNQTRAEASSNLADISAGTLVGAVEGTSRIELRQSDSGSSVQAQAVDLALGATLLEQSQLATGSGSLSVLVRDNSSRALARGNQSSLQADGIDGQLGTGGLVISASTQTLGSSLLAILGNAQLGVDDADSIATSAGGDVRLQISDNRLRSQAQGNSASQQQGQITGSQQGSVLGSISQGFGDDLDVATVGDAEASVSALATAVRIGVTAFDALGGGRQTVTQVGGNRVEVLASANQASAELSGVGRLDGLLFQQENQSLVGGSGGVRSLASDIGIGVQGGSLGSDLTAAITGNAVLAVSSGNRLQSEVTKLTGSLAGDLQSQGRQTFSGSALAVDGDLLATVENSQIGVEGVGALNLPQATVSGNSLLALAEANNAQRLVGSLSAALSGSNLELGDEQTLGQAVLGATVQDAMLGASLDSSGTLPTAFSASDNQVLAQVFGNRADQQLTLAGASSGSSADMNLLVNQTATDSSLSARVSNLQVGITTRGTGSFNGSSSISGNRVGASAVVNQSAVRRGR